MRTIVRKQLELPKSDAQTTSSVQISVMVKTMYPRKSCQVYHSMGTASASRVVQCWHHQLRNVIWIYLFFELLRIRVVGKFKPIPVQPNFGAGTNSNDNKPLLARRFCQEGWRNTKKTRVGCFRPDVVAPHSCFRRWSWCLCRSGSRRS